MTVTERPRDDEDRSPLVAQAFTDRLLGSLWTNNTLRGAWAEQIVGHYLGVVEFSHQWSYFDLTWGDQTVSVKQSVNSSARFSVERRRLAWDERVRKPGAGAPYTVENPEGWRGHVKAEPQHWCDLFVFAWLPEAASVDDVLSVGNWRFAALSRGDMHACIPANAKTVSPAALKQLGHAFVTGPDLAVLARERLAAAPPEGVTVPAIDRRTQEQIIQDMATTSRIDALGHPEVAAE